jgi:hypothetical protein
MYEEGERIFHFHHILLPVNMTYKQSEKWNSFPISKSGRSGHGIIISSVPSEIHHRIASRVSKASFRTSSSMLVP